VLYKKSLGVTLMCGIMGVTLLACGPKVITTKIHEDPYFKVHLKQNPKNKEPLLAPPYQHPLPFNENQMEHILGSIQIQYSKRKINRLFSDKKPEQEPAFSEKEVKQLAPPMAQALNQATPNDKIHFHFDHRVSVFRGGRSTGVLFVKKKTAFILFLEITGTFQESKERIFTGKSMIGSKNPASGWTIPSTQKTSEPLN